MDTKSFSLYGKLIKMEQNSFVVEIDGKVETFEVNNKFNSLFDDYEYDFYKYYNCYKYDTGSKKDKQETDISLKDYKWNGTGWVHKKTSQPLVLYDGALEMGRDGVKRLPEDDFVELHYSPYLCPINDKKLYDIVKNIPVVKDKSVKKRDAIRLIKETAERLYKDNILNMDNLYLLFECNFETELDNYIWEILYDLDIKERKM